jgi:hypothetical protein
MLMQDLQVSKPKTLTLQTGLIGYLPSMNCLEITVTQMRGLGPLRNCRLIATVNGQVSFPCAIQPRSGGGGFVMFSKKRMKEAGCIPGDRVKVQFVHDTSTYGMPMPEELEEVLHQDPYGKSRFDKLTPGKQRNIINYVSSVKSQTLRVERALKLIRNLSALPEGKEPVAAIFGIQR